MRVIEDHGMTEAILEQVLGWKWVSYVGTPVRSTPNYPNKTRVRRMLSPRQHESKEWKAFLKANDGGVADGTEPLDYSYCSSMGTIPPRILILVEGE